MRDYLAYNASARQITVHTTASPLGTEKPKTGVRIKALAANTGIIYIGETGDVSSTTGYPLDKGENIFVEVDDLSKLFVLAATNNDKLALLIT